MYGSKNAALKAAHKVVYQTAVRSSNADDVRALEDWDGEYGFLVNVQTGNVVFEEVRATICYSMLSDRWEVSVDREEWVDSVVPIHTTFV